MLSLHKSRSSNTFGFTYHGGDELGDVADRFADDRVLGKL